MLGLSWHGALEHDAFRRAFLGHVAAARGRRFVPGTASFADARAARLDVLGDLVERHMDTERLTTLIEAGVPAGLPTIETARHHRVFPGEGDMEVGGLIRTLREAGYAEILRRIREEEPPKPSTRLSESHETLPSVAAASARWASRRCSAVAVR